MHIAVPHLVRIGIMTRKNRSIIDKKIELRRQDRRFVERAVVAGIRLGGRRGYIHVVGKRLVHQRQCRSHNDCDRALRSIGDVAEIADHKIVTARASQTVRRWLRSTSALYRGGGNECQIWRKRIGYCNGTSAGQAVRYIPRRYHIGEILPGANGVWRRSLGHRHIGSRVDGIAGAGRVVGHGAIGHVGGICLRRIGTRTAIASGADFHLDYRAVHPCTANGQGRYGAS